MRSADERGAGLTYQHVGPWLTISMPARLVGILQQALPDSHLSRILY